MDSVYRNILIRMIIMENDIIDMTNYLDENLDAMLDLYRNLVEIESPSSDRSRVEEVASYLDKYLGALGLENEIFHFDEAGPTLYSQTEGKRKLGDIAIIGHMDTVHPIGAFGENPFKVQNGKVSGPGVYDMKGGLVIAIFALKALMHVGYSKRRIKLIFSGDEEVAHLYSKGEGGRLFETLCKGSSACFNCESGNRNKIVLERKGGAIFSIKVHGKAAHAGKEPEKGASAIYQAARMIVEIESRSDKDRVLYNCGTIKGGSGANVIPSEAEFSVGIRYNTNKQYEEAEEFLKGLCNDTFVKGTSSEIERIGFYPSLEKSSKSQKLFEEYRKASLKILNEDVEAIKVGGCSDSAFSSLVGVPTLCSCGVYGSGAHTLDEEADVESLFTQCKILATTIYLLADEF